MLELITRTCSFRLESEFIRRTVASPSENPRQASTSLTEKISYYVYTLYPIKPSADVLIRDALVRAL